MFSKHGFTVPAEFNEHSSVKLTNNGPLTFKATYANQPYQIAPGATVFVPWFAATHWCGNPFAINVGADRSTHWRVGETDRLNTLYGVYAAPWSTPQPYTHVDGQGLYPGHGDIEYIQRADGDYWHPQLPDLTLETADGKVLVTVLNDPEGADVTPAEAATISSNRAVNDTIQELQRQVAELQLSQARNQPRLAENPEFADTIVTDEPSVTPEPRSEGAVTTGDPRSSSRGPGRPRKSS